MKKIFKKFWLPIVLVIGFVLYNLREEITAFFVWFIPIAIACLILFLLFKIPGVRRLFKKLWRWILGNPKKSIYILIALLIVFFTVLAFRVLLRSVEPAPSETHGTNSSQWQQQPQSTPNTNSSNLGAPPVSSSDSESVSENEENTT
jgi:hypothetical protein